MYVPSAAASGIERVRELVDPVQRNLIPAHLTLCREDELSNFEGVDERLARIPFAPIMLTFGRPIPFSTHGILLPCIDGGAAFRSLRAYLLAATDIRDQAPHITLAHPRNPRGPANSLELAAQLGDNMTLVFPSIFLIEQIGGAPWRILKHYTLASPAS